MDFKLERVNPNLLNVKVSGTSETTERLYDHVKKLAEQIEELKLELKTFDNGRQVFSGSKGSTLENVTNLEIERLQKNISMNTAIIEDLVTILQPK